MSDTTVTPHATFLRHRLQEVEDIDRQARSLVASLPEGRIGQRPPRGGWSVAEVLEHLVLASSDYLGQMRPAIAAAVQGGEMDTGRSWQPTLAGRVLVHSLRTGRSGMLRAPRAWHPLSPRGNVVEGFFASQRDLASLIREVEGLDLARIRTCSPISRLIRLNLGDCLLILNVHTQRHLGQIRRVLEQLEVPLPLA